MRSPFIVSALLAGALAWPAQAALIDVGAFSASAPRIEFTGLTIPATADPIEVGNS